ncbi:hypothetical protein [Hymenobacter lucidus]|uniref:Immunity protein 45 domain-containing protein n=1 Tax=Hymenobacter lucidus TaxID=2880930 RepID=A0ABS8AXK5_9BACT|nr:hypothetical protein [Hymenobacter lucidus]MCB2410517.1 hypothetical protein [Hymenobacter lucidus]
MKKKQEREVKRGFWYYDSVLLQGVIVLAINYDYWYEIEKEDGFDMTGEVPELNDKGEMYLLVWTDAEFGKTQRHSVGTLELESTVALAEKVVNQPIEWI